MTSVLRSTIGDVQVARSVSLYVAHSRDRIIVAAMHKNHAGIYYEQSQPVLIAKWPSAEELGAAFRAAFDSFSVLDADLRNAKLSDWPAYRASKLRSVKEFEKGFRPISCIGLNPSNAVVRASTPHPTSADVELSVSFNPSSSAEAVGEHIFRLIDAAKAT